MKKNFASKLKSQVDTKKQLLQLQMEKIKAEKERLELSRASSLEALERIKTVAEKKSTHDQVMMTSQAAYGNKTNSSSIQQASSQSQAILLKNQRMLSNSININPKKKMNVQTTFDVDFYAEKA